MEPIEFKQQTAVAAKDQEEYLPFPIEKRNNDEREVISCWGLTFKERVKILFGANIYSSVWTFDSGIQPQRLFIEYPERKYTFWEGIDDNGNRLNIQIIKESKLTDEQKAILKESNIDFHE